MRLGLIAVLAFSAVIANAENILQVTPAHYDAGETNYLNIEMNNEEPIKAVSFDLYLPTGITLGSIAGIYPAYSDEVSDYEAPINGSRNAYYSSEDGLYHTAQTLSKSLGYDASDDYVGGGTCNRFLTTSISAYPFSGTSGQIMRIQINTDATAAGVYPIVMRNVQMAGTDGLKLKLDKVISYITVGNPTTSALTMGGVIPSFVKSAILSDPAVSALDFSSETVADEAALSAEYKDKLILGPTKTSYSRNVTGLGTVCLPMDITVAAGTKYYELAEVNGDVLRFAEVTASTVPANTPVLVKGNIAVSAEGYHMPSAATVEGATVGGYTIKGNYELRTNVTGEYYFGGEQSCWYATNPITVNPFRATMTTASGARALTILVADEATGIEEVTDQLSDEDIFNIQGMKLQNAQRGVNIINGKKVLVK